jgi:hypothetical protein
LYTPHSGASSKRNSTWIRPLLLLKLVPSGNAAVSVEAACYELLFTTLMPSSLDSVFMSGRQRLHWWRKSRSASTSMRLSTCSRCRTCGTQSSKRCGHSGSTRGAFRKLAQVPRGLLCHVRCV